MATEKQIRELLSKVRDPETNKNIMEIGMVQNLKVTGDTVSFTLALSSLSHRFKDRIVGDAKSAVRSADGIQAVEIFLAEMAPVKKAPLQKEDSLKGEAENRFYAIEEKLKVVRRTCLTPWRSASSRSPRRRMLRRLPGRRPKLYVMSRR